MGRQGKKTPGPDGLGKALQRRQQKTAEERRAASRGQAAAVAMGTDGRGKLVSVLEASDFDEFIANVMLEEAVQDARAEKPLVMGLGGELEEVLGGDDEERGEEEGGGGKAVGVVHEHLSLPRRPKWKEGMSAEELNQLEQRAFLDWRRAIADKEEMEHRRKVTPFEKNLEVWRQLWRVMERSDLIVQIVDARNPFFYYSADLEEYGASLTPPKPMVVLVNKGDLLTASQRRSWLDYYRREGKSRILFFSAAASLKALVDEARKQRGDESHLSSDEEGEEASPPLFRSCEEEGGDAEVNLLSRGELLAELQSLAMEAVGPGGPVHNQGRLCCGMVGYPNVGKSSVINVLVGATHLTHGVARVSVGSTPGKTKHFQTIALSDALMLCDCPGLVFPSFVSSAAEMICMGVLPLMNLRDPLPAAEIVALRIPRHILELVYSIILKETDRGGLGPQESLAQQLLRVICEARGFQRAQALGEPDTGRAARLLIKDFTSGKLAYCHPPPGLSDDERVSFLAETEVTQLQQARMAQKLREKAKKVGMSEGGVLDTEAVQDLLRQREEEISQAQAERPNGPTKAEQGFKLWAKKGKKLRNPTPYDDESWKPGQSHQVLQQRRGKKGSRKLDKHEAKRQERLAREAQAEGGP